jgi:hypothetical protein
MHQNSVKMHQTTSKEILDGNLKSIMRLVLALAAHYKPTNVQPYSSVIARSNQTYSPSSGANHVVNKRSYSTNYINSQNNPVVTNPVPINPNSNNNLNLRNNPTTINTNNNPNTVNNTYVVENKQQTQPQSKNANVNSSRYYSFENQLFDFRFNIVNFNS